MTSLGGALLDKLQIFKALKNTSNIVIDEDKFYNKTQENETAYKNSFDFNSETKVITIKCNNFNLKFNASKDQKRFRYFSSEQNDIQLYKLAN